MLPEHVIESIARSSFARYKRQRMCDGLPIEYERFDDQPETLMESCRSQARDIERKVGLMGCSIVKSGRGVNRVEVFSEEEVELLARVEHDRWVNERVADGWAYGPVKDVDVKLSPFLVPWEDLSEQVRDYDRRPVRDIIPLLDSVGLAVTRGGRGGG